MVLEEPAVELEPELRQPPSVAVINVLVATIAVFIELGCIFIHLRLRVNILEQLCMVPPLRVGLDQHFIWLQFLNEFLGTLGKHRRLVARANQKDFFVIESFSEMDQSCLEDRVTVTNSSIAFFCPAVCCAFENMDRELSCTLRAYHLLIELTIAVLSDCH